MVVEDIAYVGIVEGTVDGIANEEGLEQPINNNIWQL